MDRAMQNKLTQQGGDIQEMEDKIASLTTEMKTVCIFFHLNFFSFALSFGTFVKSNSFPIRVDKMPFNFNLALLKMSQCKFIAHTFFFFSKLH